MKETQVELTCTNNMAWQKANRTTRLLNGLIDHLFFYMISVILSALFDIALTYFEIKGLPENELTLWFGYAVLLPAYILYFTVLEYFTNGKTIAKFITATHVVNHKGAPIGLTQAVGRSICRLIPFEPLSYLFVTNGWHDSITRTMVVKDER